MKAAKALYALAGASALAFALTASKCETDTVIVPYVQEICNDKIDNDGDGLIDCQDSDCDVECKVQVNINPISPISTDSLTVTGTHFNATGIALSILPSGSAGAAVISGNSWTAHLTLLSDKTTYTLTAIASDAQGRLDTATATLIRNN